MKSNKFISLQILFTCLFILASCQDDISDNIKFKTMSIYDEKNYQFNTIKLWGSEAAVIDMGDYYAFQGDIRLYKTDSLKYSKYDTRGAGRTDKKWPDNKVYYSIEGVPNDIIPYIYEAINWIQNGSYIEMIARYNQNDYIQFSVNSEVETAYSDYIGRKGGKQNIVLGTYCSKRPGTIAHEICHAIGMYHEMCRTDRDNYVTINFDGMNEQLRYQYKTFAELGQAGINVGEFDYSSIMMYPSNGVMFKLNGDYIYGQRDSLTNTDMQTLAKIQPIGNNYMFFDPLGYNPPVYTDYEYQNSKILQCPEGANIDFKFQYKNNPTASKYGAYNKDDFDIKAIISIVNRKNSKEIFHQNIPLNNVSSWTDIYIKNINIPQGGFTTKLILTGSINGTVTQDKLNVLKELLYYPQLYLELDKVTINGNNKNIPNEFGNPNRTFTFISI